MKSEIICPKCKSPKVNRERYFKDIPTEQNGETGTGDYYLCKCECGWEWVEFFSFTPDGVIYCFNCREPLPHRIRFGKIKHYCFGCKKYLKKLRKAEKFLGKNG